MPSFSSSLPSIALVLLAACQSRGASGNPADAGFDAPVVEGDLLPPADGRAADSGAGSCSGRFCPENAGAGAARLFAVIGVTSAGDELWIGGETSLHYKAGAFTQVPVVPAGSAIGHLWSGVRAGVFATTLDGWLLSWSGAAWVDKQHQISGYLGGMYGEFGGEDLIGGPLWIVGYAGTILRGETGAWNPVPSPAAANLYGISGSGTGDIWSAGDHGILVHFDGTSWSSQKSPTTATLLDLWSGTGAAAEAYAVGPGVILHHDNTGWSVVDPGLPAGPAVAAGTLTGVYGSGPTDVWAVGQKGLIVHYDGKSWSLPDSGTKDDLQAVWESQGGEVWAVGDSGTVLRRRP